MTKCAKMKRALSSLRRADSHNALLLLLHIAQIIKRAVRNVYEMGLEDFIFGHPAQIALLGIQFQWTADTQVGEGPGLMPGSSVC